MIRIGTSGYSFENWKGHFYPEDIKKNEMLDFYVKHFDTVEINYTYYRIPEAHTFERMVERTPDNFEFAVKTHRTMTHERQNNEASFAAFKEGIQPLIDANKLNGVLAQFPWAFKNTQANRLYLTKFKEQMTDYPLVVEFRHDSWILDAVFDWFSKLDISYCCVDEPRLKGLVPPVAVATNDLGYVRFHGRNEETWWGGDASERYDYSYTQQELFEWLPKIKEVEKSTQKTVVFFNNCHNGQAANNAQLMLDLFN